MYLFRNFKRFFFKGNVYTALPILLITYLFANFIYKIFIYQGDIMAPFKSFFSMKLMLFL